MKKFCIPVLLLALWLLTSGSGYGQKSAANPYGLPVVSDTNVYKQQVANDSSMKMVDLASYIPGLLLDIRYATPNNFTGKQIYTRPAAFARLPVAKALRQVQQELAPQGLTLKIFDAYRPYSATLLFYQTLKDTTFVAAPWKGSRHNRGCAVDLTLVITQSGKELEMPTPFDEFSVRAKPGYSDLPKKVILNVGMLTRLMQKNGFSVYPDEWWHFDYEGWNKYPLMDLSFEWLEHSK